MFKSKEVEQLREMLKISDELNIHLNYQLDKLKVYITKRTGCSHLPHYNEVLEMNRQQQLIIKKLNEDIEYWKEKSNIKFNA